MFRNREDVVGIVLRFGRGRPACMPHHYPLHKQEYTRSMPGQRAHTPVCLQTGMPQGARRGAPLLEDYGAGKRGEASGTFLS